MNLGTLIVTLGADTRQLKAAQAQLVATGNSMRAFGRSMSMYVTLPLAVAGGAAFKMYKDFESSLTKIVGLVGVARDQVGAWGEDILRMAPALGKSPKELADAMFFITSAGIRGAEALEVLEMSAKASAAGLGETQVVADLVTSAMNAYGKEVLNAEAATDVLVAAVREGKAQADALASSMGMVLPIASAMKVSFDQVGAAVAAMTRTGTSAQTASMQLRQILNSLLKPTQQAEDALYGMNTSAAALRRTIREEGLLSALMKIRDLTKKYGEEVMADVFPNIRALAGVLDIMGSNLQDNIKIFDSLADSTGSLARAFEEVTKTAEFKWNQALAHVKTLLTTVGKTIADELSPVLIEFGRRMANITDWFNNLNDAQKGTIIKIGGLVAAIGPLIIILGALTKAIAGLFTRTGLIMAGLSLLVGVIATIIMRTREMTAAEEALSSVLDTARKSIMDQRVELDQLLKIARDETRALEERKTAVEALNRISPQYLGDLELATINTNNATKAIQAYTEELLRQAKVQAAQEKLVELQKKYYDEIEQKQAAQLSGWQKFVRLVVQGTGDIGDAEMYAAEKMTENFERTKDELTSAQEALQIFLNELLTVADLVDDMSFIPGGDEGGDDTIATMKRITDAMDVQIELADNMRAALGEMYDDAAAKSQIYFEAVGKLLKAGFEPTDAVIVSIINSMRRLNTTVAETAAVIDDALEPIYDLPGALEKTRVMNDMLGNSFDLAQAELQIYTQAFNKLWDEGVRPGSEAMDFLMGKITELSSGLGDMEDVSTSLGDQLNNLAHAFSALGSAVSRASEDSKITFAEAMNVIAKTATTAISILGALAAAEIIAKESAKGIIGIFTAVAGLAALAGIWATFVKPEKYTPMAEGAIVTRPTLAMVGEKGPEGVFPLEKMKDIMATHIYVTVEGVARGEDIHYIVKEVERRHTNNF